MKHSCAVLLVLLLARAPSSHQLLAQQTDIAEPGRADRRQGEVRGLELEQNYPNPFRDETRIPLILGPDLFEEGRSVIVTVQIYNVLRQVVAIPTVLDHPSAAGQPVRELRFDQPGRYLLYWDGRDSSGRPVASGIYFCQVTANRERAVLKMIVTR